MADVQFTGQQSAKNVYFSDLNPNENFTIVSSQSRGAVYRKVVSKYNPSECYMMEEASGLLYTPTASKVRRVDVDVTVHAPPMA